MNGIHRVITYGFILGFSLSCATLQTEFREPTVSITYLRALPAEGMTPRFEIGLHVANPNRVALEISGLSYTVDIEEHRILNGVAKDLDVIDAYSEADISLTATADVISSISLVSDLMRQPRDVFTYKLTAILDFGNLYPVIPIEKKGQIYMTAAGG